MFYKLKYRVLYEGIESDSDEQRCIKMKAKYLQGFKYSRPVPSGMLKNFLSKDYDSVPAGAEL